MLSSVPGLGIVKCIASELDGVEDKWPDDGELGWRIHVRGTGLVFPMKFAREIDAKAAMSALAPFGDWCNDWEDIITTRSREIRIAMASAMAW